MLIGLLIGCGWHSFRLISVRSVSCPDSTADLTSPTGGLISPVAIISSMTSFRRVDRARRPHHERGQLLLDGRVCRVDPWRKQPADVAAQDAGRSTCSLMP